MKVFFLVFTILLVGIVIWWFFQRQHKKFHWHPVRIASLSVLFLLGILAGGIYKSATAPDVQCSQYHQPTSTPPKILKTAPDYFLLGNYDYDTGDCVQAVGDYTKALALNPNYPEAYNNRAYTNMRLRNYQDALPDLNKAIMLNPNYVEALMNRGDIHNYYYQIDRASAIVDYRKVISLGATSDSSVCGHLFLAEHNGWTPGAYVDFFLGKFHSCQ